MFTFEDKGGRSLTLRPEGTAPICRAYVEHGMHKLAQPVKLSYVGPFFRHERPQAGRYRQFHQLGAEAIGTDSPLADAEVIMLLADLLAELGVPGVELRLGSLGSLGRAPAYLEELKAHLRAHEGELSKDVRERIDVNPLRAFDSDDEGTRAVMASAPTIVERARGRGRRALRRGAGAARRRRGRLRDRPDPGPRPRLLHAHDLLLRLRPARRPVGDRRRRPLRRPDRAARRPADAGGRLGGGDRADPAGARRGGARRRGATPSSRSPTTASGSGRWRWPGGELRHAGLSAEVDLAGRGLKGQLKHADRIGARRVLILEADGRAQLRDMDSGEQRAVDTGNLVDEMTGGEAMSELPGRCAPTATATPGAARCWATGSTPRRGSPAGSTAAATTAG